MMPSLPPITGDIREGLDALTKDIRDRDQEMRELLCPRYALLAAKLDAQTNYVLSRSFKFWFRVSLLADRLEKFCWRQNWATTRRWTNRANVWHRLSMWCLLVKS